ncbi:hypothetical protein [Amycolatopsis sp. NPDC059657]|uniref:hypothetical protein n=1 Tax=Amycolatopsis sp. NPDC059657 TaxID=3346899 RepID=UPI00366DA56C
MQDNDSENNPSMRPGSEGLLPLGSARNSFAWLVTGPDPMAVDGRRFPGLPDRLVPLDELRDRLLDPACTGRTRDAVWRFLIGRSRAEGAAWTVACVGMALPTLARSAARLAGHFRGDRADLHAAILTGFLEALTTVEVGGQRLSQQLRWAAFRAGHAAVTESLDAPIPAEPEAIDASVDAPLPWAAGFRSTSPHRPWGHPDLVLARAVAVGVLTPPEAELIATTRLEEIGLADWAELHDMPHGRANLARWRAEQRLVAYLLDEARETDPDDPVTTAAFTSLALRSAPGTTTPPPGQSPTVSGHGRNGRPTSSKKFEPAVKENGPKSGLLKWRGSTPTAAPSTSPEQISEVRRCA